jgi:DNA segregation ATPase FtsK/SpoIIIE-like protein
MGRNRFNRGKNDDDKKDEKRRSSRFGRGRDDDKKSDDKKSSRSSRFGRGSDSDSKTSSSRFRRSSDRDNKKDDDSGSRRSNPFGRDSSGSSPFSRDREDDKKSSSSRFRSRGDDKKDDKDSSSPFGRRSGGSSSRFSRDREDDKKSSSSRFRSRSDDKKDDKDSSSPFGRRSGGSSSRFGRDRDDDKKSSSSRFRSRSDDKKSSSSSFRGRGDDKKDDKKDDRSSRTSSRFGRSDDKKSSSSRFGRRSDDKKSSSSRFGRRSDDKKKDDDTGGRTFGRSGTRSSDNKKSSSSRFGRRGQDDKRGDKKSSSRFGRRGSDDKKKEEKKTSSRRFGLGRRGGDDKKKASSKSDKPARASGRFGDAKQREESGSFLDRINPFSGRGGDSDKKKEDRRSAKAARAKGSSKKPLPEEKKVPKNVTRGLDLDRKLDIAGGLLFVFALLTFFGWLQTITMGDTGAGGFTITLDNILAQVFGNGRLVVSLAAGWIGGWLLIRYFGKMFDIDYFRIAGMIITFASFLATLQWWDLMFAGFPSINYVPDLETLNAQSEALWQAGAGGGVMGHVLYMFFETLFGDMVFAVFLFCWWVAGLYLALDLDLRQISERFIAIRAARAARREERRKEEAEKIKEEPIPQPAVATPAVAGAAAGGGTTAVEEKPRRAGLFGGRKDGRKAAPSDAPITADTDEQPQRKAAVKTDTSGRKAAPSDAPITADTDQQPARRGGILGRFFGGRRKETPQPAPAKAEAKTTDAKPTPDQKPQRGGVFGRSERKTDEKEAEGRTAGRRAFTGQPKLASTDSKSEGRTAPPEEPVADKPSTARPTPEPPVKESEEKQVAAEQKTEEKVAEPSKPAVEQKPVETKVAEEEKLTPDTKVEAVEISDDKKEEAVTAKPRGLFKRGDDKKDEKAAAFKAAPKPSAPEKQSEQESEPVEQEAKPAVAAAKPTGETKETAQEDKPEPAVAEAKPAATAEMELAKPAGLSDSAYAAVAAVSAPPSDGRKSTDLAKSKAEQAADELKEAEQAISEGRWRRPDFARLLEEGSEQTIEQQILLDRAKTIEDTLDSFGAPGKVVEVNTGPVITQFGVEPDYIERRGGSKSRVKVSAIAGLEKDIALALAAKAIRIEAPVPGKGYVGIEVPNAEAAVVSLRDVMMSEEHQKKLKKTSLTIGLGRRVDGLPMSADLTQMPHLLIAGATGSGKSVCVNAIISCLLLQNTPEELQFIMVDPKRVELAGYNGIPHLVSPVVVDLERIVGVLKWVQREMDDRYRKFANVGARNITDYNENKLPHGESRMPYLIVIVDELADLMMLAPDETERLIARLAQMARATGIHLIISTQRPSVDVVTGLIKANFPARIAFAVASSVDSRVILDQPGAEKLLGRGDMLFQAPDAPAPTRMQGAFVSDGEINRITHYWKSVMALQNKNGGSKPGMNVTDAQNVPQVQSRTQRFSPTSSATTTNRPSNPQQQFWDKQGDENSPSRSDGEDELYEKAVELVRQQNRASIAMLQRNFRINHSRAQRLMQILEEKGIVETSEDNGGSSVRKVLPPKQS